MDTSARTKVSPRLFLFGALSWITAGALLTAGCLESANGSGVDSGGRGGSGASSGQGGSGADGNAGGFGGTIHIDDDAGNQGSCAVGAEWIYLVDSNYSLLQFRPDSLTLTEIGRLSCPTSAGDTPFSMAVDRRARAWVLYQSGNIFHVDLATSACTASGFAPNQAGLRHFGMGFVSDDTGGGETLFVAGGGSVTNNATLATIDTASLVLSPIGNLTGWPELTGTGAAELWAFSPNTNPPTIQRLDKTSGAVAENYGLPSLTGSPSAWAFAFWGGSFYVFLQRASEPSTQIWHFNPDTQDLTRPLSNIGYRIVGAGVSTCAPLVPPA
ncbi:MAG: hypothetical protein KIT72_18940 [Polyangiaceae bacterium]|nr:hypothetical protein [Polyangiaceae bacterium]MCW5792497.1 hypothetical protein [Polyangiaceae bacterium]